MTHHNQTKELTLGFSISPLMSPLTTKGTKFEVRIQTPQSTARRSKANEKHKKAI
jgi:hypothetical protein